MEVAGELLDLVAVFGQPDEPVAKRAIVTAFDPGTLGTFLARQEAEVNAHYGVLPRVEKCYVISASAIGEHASPGKGTTLKACALGCFKQPLQPFLRDFTYDLTGHADIAALAIPFLPRRGLEF